MASVSQIAELFGVSESTVYRVKNGRNGVSESNRKAISDYIAEHGCGEPESIDESAVSKAVMAAVIAYADSIVLDTASYAIGPKWDGVRLGKEEVMLGLKHSAKTIAEDAVRRMSK